MGISIDLRCDRGLSWRTVAAARREGWAWTGYDENVREPQATAGQRDVLSQHSARPHSVGIGERASRICLPPMGTRQGSTPIEGSPAVQLRRKRASQLQSVIDTASDPKRRREIAEHASETAARIVADVAKKSADVGSRVGEKVTEVALAATEEGDHLMKHHQKDRKAKKPRRHRLRNAAFLTGLGAAAAYFFDPQNGTQRRAVAQRRTSSSAQAVGDSLDKAAHVAHQTAEATGAEATTTLNAGMPRGME